MGKNVYISSKNENGRKTLSDTQSRGLDELKLLLLEIIMFYNTDDSDNFGKYFV